MPSDRPPIIAPRANPHAPEAAVFIDRWVRRTGLIQSFSAQQRFRKAGCADYAARVMPDADRERLKRGAAWLVWLFILDDQVAEHGPGGLTGQSPPFADALLDFLPPDLRRTPPPRTAAQRGWPTPGGWWPPRCHRRGACASSAASTRSSAPGSWRRRAASAGRRG
ncbi:hypothetical protein ACFQ2B_25595 [Streptomyces stramineus]